MRTAPDPADALTPAGERIHEVAARLFYERGIRATGVDLVADEAGTTKKTLYDRFGSKDGLVAFYLGRRNLRWQRFVLDRLAAEAPGLPTILAFYDALAAWLVESTRGCGFVNAHAEIAGTDHPGLAVVHAEKAWARALYVDAARDAGVADPDTVGTRLFLLHEGAVVASTAGGVTEAVAVARECARDIVRTARAGDSHPPHAVR
ncbi:TetR/AcrR family transcriptional regulator [Rhodococcoides corynebacterioides]|uniref:TetR/AcrR family transcriptional regulator n=1 Tax=Rhodococcoides corynebacterioides TaxID=53972 RepID=A0ABS7P6A4_9NOCA|nr:TetR/AcrR family transcriptional regulator [Rhodococcus corynebacterioides]MBY6367954.1 TetR/AcrR family transcriptional regulator [Rhodococcus corynebacterioides]MBY6409418.1 TetR/AcrR family transcriptional regulator [Rhodococcus corynebacterioides]